MGYHDTLPDNETFVETLAVIDEVARFLRPRLGFVVRYGMLDIDQGTLQIAPNDKEAPVDLHIKSIIARQLRGSEAYALFVATAGIEFEDFQRQLVEEGDMVKVFIANALGSVITEKCADKMEQLLQEAIDKLNWHHTNRFSPGYCAWHVSEQQILFPLLGNTAPCGIELTDSSLMIPIKSVSGILGLGKKVRKNEYSCGLCEYEKCYKRNELKK